MTDSTADSAADLARRKLTLFGVLAVALIALAYVPLIRTGRMDALGGWAVMGVMWAPGVAGMLASLIVSRNLRGMGWGLGRPHYLVLAYVLPLLYALPVYGLVWASGLGTFLPQMWLAETRSDSLSTALVLLLTRGFFFSIITALGEEIGWRGLLVPQLARLTSFRNVWLISAAVWLAYHVPIIVTTDYRGQGTPLAYSLACFAGLVFFDSAIMAWIRLRSGSLWPAAVLHAAHNLFVQGVFDAATGGPSSAWFTGEFAIGLVVTIAATAFVLTRPRGSIPTPLPAG
jgi:membrane protease YdiL (CAAX protease family)